MGPVVIDARDGYAPQLRGWGRHVRDLVEALERRAAFQYEIVRTGGRGPEVAFEQVGLPLLLRRRGAALVHSPNCFLPLVRPCPGVVTVHDLAFEAYPDDFAWATGIKFREITKRAVRSAQRVICVSAFTRDDVCERYGISPEKCRVVPNAPSLPIGTTAPPAGESYLLGVGDLRAKKNLGVAVEALRALRLAGHGHRLVLAGADAGEGAALRALAGKLPVEFTGYVDDARLDALMRGADVLVHPSRYEGFGLVVIEAMARGVPVVVADATALPETAGDAGLHFDPDDPAALAARVREALARRGELAALGRGRAAQFSWDHTAQLTEDVYRELL